MASRHPEFADHLLGSAWGDIPAFHTGSLRNRRRGSGSSSSYQGHPDEDTRSQASGGSAKSAASGASGVSSQGEPPLSEHYPNKQDSSSRRNPIPQYGLRNTVDIGQHRHDMENPEKGNRGQRSMSAPPENRDQDEIPSQESQQNPNQRFVSRVDITPQFPQQPGNEKVGHGAKTQPQPQAQQQKPQQQQSNVRHIPIFVEGRDEPVNTKNAETDHVDGSWTYTKPQPTAPPQFQPPPQFQSPPQFHRPSHFNPHYAGRARDWLPNFEEEFYTPQSTFQQSSPRRTQQSPPRQAPQSHFRQPQTESRQQRAHQQQEQPHFAQQQPQQKQQQQPKQPPQKHETPAQQPRKQTQPKDPLDKVAEVQKEVDGLTEQVKLWNGDSRKDKQYMYIDEMLTRELIKLDDIETEGKDNVRQARKNAIKCIQDSISLLESKAPLPGQAQPQQTIESQERMDETSSTTENMETVENKDEQIVDDKEQSSLVPENKNAQQQPIVQDNQSNVGEQRSQETTTMEVANVDSMEVQGIPETNNQLVAVQKSLPSEDGGVTSMEVVAPLKSPKTAKKVKKTRKQPQQRAPICDDPIPLPAPQSLGLP